MEIDAIRLQFISASERFLRKVESHLLGDNPSRLHRVDNCVRELTMIWDKVLVAPLDELARVNDTSVLIDCVMAFAASVDVALVATKMGISDTSRGVIAQVQRDILDFGSKFASALSAHVNAILKNKSLDVGQVEQVLRARAHIGLGPVFSKIARRYAPLMHPDALIALREILLVQTIDALLGVEHTPIDAKRPIYEQILTSGSLIPLTQSMSRNALFDMFNEKYDMQHDIAANLARIADNMSANIVLLSKVVPRAIEFDSRGLFDFAFVRKNDLIVPKFLGLCDKAINRFNTVHVLTESKAVVPNYFYHAAPQARSKGATADKTLVLESLTGNLFRIMGSSLSSTRQESDTMRQGGAIAPRGERFMTDSMNCKFLALGQSTRADQYHRRAEEAIFANGQSEEVRSIVTIFQTTGTNMLLADALRSRITIRMREFLRKDLAHEIKPVGGEFFDMCVNSLQDVMPSIKNHTIDLSAQSMFFSKLFKLANKLATFLEPFMFTFGDADHSSKERIVDSIMQSAADEELFTIDETLNMVYLEAVRKTTAR